MFVADIKKDAKGTKYESLVFKIVNINKVETKTFEEKTWTEQKLKVEDSQGKSIKLVLYKNKIDLDLQDTYVEFLNCELNKYDTQIDNKNVTVNYLKCWGGFKPADSTSINKTPQATQPPGQVKAETKQPAATQPPPDWDNINSRNCREQCIKNTIPLITADKITLDEMEKTAQKMYDFIYGIKKAEDIGMPF